MIITPDYENRHPTIIGHLLFPSENGPTDIATRIPLHLPFSRVDTAMTSQAEVSPLLNLPREIRDLIFSYCICYPDLSVLLSNHLERARLSFKTHLGPEIQEAQLEELLPWSSFEQPEPLHMQTPGIFLVNRQISAEALDILHSKILLLDVPVPVTNNRNVRAVFVTDFIGEETLQSARYCFLELSFTTMAKASAWYRMTQHLIDIWAVKNALLCLTINIDANALAPFEAPLGAANTAFLATGFRKYIMFNVSMTSHDKTLGLIVGSSRICPTMSTSDLPVLHRH